MNNLPPHIKGLLFAALGALSLTPDGLLVRLTEGNDWTTVFWRGLFIAIGLLIAMIIRDPRNLIKNYIPDSFKAWGAVVFSALGTLTFVLAITHTSVANVLVILSTISLFAALLSMVFLKETIAMRTWIAMGCAIVGILIVFMDDFDATGMEGKIYALACAFFTAANMTLIRSAKSISVPAVFAFGGLSIAGVALVMAPTLSINTQQFGVLATMGGLNALAFVLLGLGAKLIPAPEVSLLMLLETIFGPVWVWAILNEVPSQNALIGGTIVVTTLAAHSYASLRAGKR